ncbi:hypothetical protein P171DRAFT_8401 [Karstenula rhodostoma CBS 690.94]|uniref:Uncharacterized protein n=1 Tax=Karstenula rhodostoma CBS 690.94 TaxID=1392251 RepID=A0A9P4PWL1_9PLEO|nr:hypothetical protein P171DRAFT_8401 [Karstenula rhodostoma CBS 690.94]
MAQTCSTTKPVSSSSSAQKPKKTAESKKTKLTKVAKRTPKKPFRNIPQGAGRTFTFPFPTTIGTTACNTCLGLYVPLTRNTCFIAHFNFEPQSNTGRTRTQRLKNYEVGPACYRAVVMMTKEFLNDAQWKGCWGALTPNMRRGLRMVCPKAGVTGKTYTGDAMAEGVSEFFGVTGENAVPRRCGNLLVRYAEGAAPAVIYSDDAELRRGWEATDEDDNENFAMAEFFDDGRVMKEGTAEGPFEA